MREQRERGAQHRLPVSLILLVSMTAAGVVYPVTDSALHHTSPIMIATLRAIVGGLLLTAMLPLMGSRLPGTRRLWVWAFAIGLGNTTLTQVGISVGTARAGAAVAAVLLNSSPFFVAVIAWFALAEPITRLRAAGLVIGFGGVLLVVLADPGNIAHGSRLAVGLALSLLGALGWAAGGVGMRVLTQRESDLDIVGITAAQFLAGGVPLIPLVLLAGGSTAWGERDGGYRAGHCWRRDRQPPTRRAVTGGWQEQPLPEGRSTYLTAGPFRGTDLVAVITPRNRSPPGWRSTATSRSCGASHHA